MLIKVAVNIALGGLGKKYFKEWIFRNLDFSFELGKSYAIIGPNGSGKSTFLKVISGAIPPTEGTLVYQKGEKVIDSDYLYKQISYAAPYLDLIEDLTLKEILQFHFQFKKTKDNLSQQQIAEIMFLEDALNKQVKFFSSGMKQRLKLGLAFFSDTPILLLDEPTTNLDQKGTNWYLEHAIQQQTNRIIVICSNQPYEYEFCTQQLNILHYKKNVKNI